MMDIMKELAEIINLGTDDLKKIIGDGTIKVVHNGEPVIDIENGVDKLAPKDDNKKGSTHIESEKNCACTVPKKESKEVTSSVSYNSKNCSCTNSSHEYSGATTPSNIWLNDNLLMVNPNKFIIANEIAGYHLLDSQTEITFSHKTSDSWVPGITDNQLLTILCERFKKEPKKVETLKALMNS